jgi:arginine deiminase
VILVEVGRIPIKGGCSSCKGVTFTTGIDISTAQEQHSKLESLFREHFRKVHMHEDASQKAAST